MLLSIIKTALKSKDLVIFSSTMYNEYLMYEDSNPFFHKYVFRKNKRKLNYRRDSSYFLKYLVKRVRLNNVFEGNVFEDEQMVYADCLKKYLRYFYRFSAFRRKSNLSFQSYSHSSSVVLVYRLNGLVGCRPFGRGLKNFYRLRALESRFRSDNNRKHEKTLYHMTKKSKDAKYKNFFFFKKAKDEEDKLPIIWKQYHYLRQWRPYSHVRKTPKLFFNVGDHHITGRFPIYRYKFPLLYHFPRYANYRRLYKNQLREQHLFRWLYRLKLSQLINYFRKSTNNKKYSFELMFLKHFEWRLDTIVHRLNFAFSLKHARQLVNRGFFTVNNKIINHYTFHVSVGDLIMPIKRLRIMKHGKRYLHKKDRGLTFMNLRLFYRPIQMDQYPEHFLINERIPAALIIKNLNPLQLRYTRPFSIQYLTLSLLKYT